jgi:uncharacterized protein YbcC (UPF0753/DUF2309 family)
MPERSRGIHGSFLEIYDTVLAAQCGRWARGLPALVADGRANGRTALGSIENSLAQLGVHDDEWIDYLSAELLALRGWAGIVRQIESELQQVDDLRRRRILHQAFERGIRRRLYDALAHHTPQTAAAPPAFQAILCIDEREESFRSASSAGGRGREDCFSIGGRGKW